MRSCKTKNLVRIEETHYFSNWETPVNALKMTVINPGDNDVLLGRGGNNNKHVGNQKLREIALSYAQEYSKCTKMGKSDL